MAKILGIYIAPEGGKTMESREAVRAVPGRGLEGDRYFHKNGTYSQKSTPDRQVTLIEQEALDAVAADYEIPLPPGASRRNLITSGVALNHLVGREFCVGAVRLRGIKLCEPCGHLEKMTGEKVRQPLVHRGGLRAEILTEGVIRVGDGVEADQ